MDFFLIRVQPEPNQLKSMTIDSFIKLKIFNLNQTKYIYYQFLLFFKCWSYLYIYVVLCISFAFYVHHDTHIDSLWHFRFPFSHNPKRTPHTHMHKASSTRCSPSLWWSLTLSSLLRTSTRLALTVQLWPLDLRIMDLTNLVYVIGLSINYGIKLLFYIKKMNYIFLLFFIGYPMIQNEPTRSTSVWFGLG